MQYLLESEQSRAKRLSRPTSTTRLRLAAYVFDAAYSQYRTLQHG